MNNTKIYDSSTLMKMVGHSNACASHVEEIEHIAKARNIKDADILMFACDIFNYAFICGKREERSRHKA